MTTVADIQDFMNTLAPKALAYDWDNNGLLLGSGKQAVTKILVALDPFEDVAQEAADWGAQVIVTHHPLIMNPLKSITDETSVGRTAMCLLQNGIAAINAHTCLDITDGGVNDCLAAKLGLSEVSKIAPDNLMRIGSVEPTALPDFLQTVKEKLGCPGLRYVDSGRPCQRICVGGGACAGELLKAVEAGCDTFVTADVKYNQFWEAANRNINLIDAGHFYTENPVCEFLLAKLTEAFPAVSVRISKNHRDVCKFF